jgi:hypothetical protein
MMARRRRKLSLAACFNSGLTSLTICQSKKNSTRPTVQLFPKIGGRAVCVARNTICVFLLHTNQVCRTTFLRCIIVDVMREKNGKNNLIRSTSKGIHFKINSGIYIWYLHIELRQSRHDFILFTLAL